MLPSRKCCSGLRQEMWCVVKVGHSSGVRSRANPPAPPSLPALAQGGWWLGETCFRRAEAPRGGGAVALEAGFVFQVFLPLYLKGVGCSFCFTQLGSAPARAPLQDGLCSGMSPPSHPADLPGLGEATGSVSWVSHSCSHAATALDMELFSHFPLAPESPMKTQPLPSGQAPFS